MRVADWVADWLAVKDRRHLRDIYRMVLSIPDSDQIVDGVLQAVVEVVLPEDAGHARMGDDVCVAHLFLAAWERPVLLRAPCMMR